MESTIIMIVVYFLIQSCIISISHSRSVHIDQSKPRPTFNDAVIDLLEENKLDLSNTSTTESLQDEAAEGHSNFNSVLLRLKRNINPCEEGREPRKWNHCLGKYISKPKCRNLSVACLSANNVPPKCKKNYVVETGKDRRRCVVLKSCSCAA